jgi:hypothetical protein
MANKRDMAVAKADRNWAQKNLDVAVGNKGAPPFSDSRNYTAPNALRALKSSHAGVKKAYGFK